MTPTTLQQLDLGEAITIVVELADPETRQPVIGTVTMTVRHETAGTTLAPTVESVAPGRYTALVKPMLAGAWTVRVEVSGDHESVKFGRLVVRQPPAGF
jgi:hypothetical protein